MTDQEIARLQGELNEARAENTRLVGELEEAKAACFHGGKAAGEVLRQMKDENTRLRVDCSTLLVTMAVLASAVESWLRATTVDPPQSLIDALGAALVVGPRIRDSGAVTGYTSDNATIRQPASGQ